MSIERTSVGSRPLLHLLIGLVEMLALCYQFVLIFAVALPLQTDEFGDDWFVVAPPGAGATVEMPHVPQFRQKMMQPVRDMDEILVRTRSTVTNNGNTSLTFVYHDELRRPGGRSQIKKVLTGAMTGAIALVNGELVSENEIFNGSNKGRDFVYTCEVSDAKLQRMHALKIRSQILLVGKRLYSLNYISLITEYDDRSAERFFDSFQLVKTALDLPPGPRAGRARALANEPADASVPQAKPSEPIREEPIMVDEKPEQDGSGDKEEAIKDAAKSSSGD